MRVLLHDRAVRGLLEPVSAAYSTKISILTAHFTLWRMTEVVPICLPIQGVYSHCIGSFQEKSSGLLMAAKEGAKFRRHGLASASSQHLQMMKTQV